MPRVSAPRLISDAKQQPAAPALDAAVEAASTTTTAARRARKPSSQNARSGTKTRRAATTTKGKTPTKREEPTEPTGEKQAAEAEAEAEAEQTVAATTRRAPARPEFPDEPEGIPGEKRITLPLWQSLWRALSLARLDDGVDTTVRIRSMIELWEHDPRIRAKVDKLALQRAGTMHRGRPRKA